MPSDLVRDSGDRCGKLSTQSLDKQAIGRMVFGGLIVWLFVDDLGRVSMLLGNASKNWKMTKKSSHPPCERYFILGFYITY
jgi:hypothetical protein